jgi:hypothetical protein
MTYKGTIDENKQIVISRELNSLDKQLIKVAYTSPEIRKTALMIVVSNSTDDLKHFAEGRKWKNPETSNLIGVDRLLELASQDKMWAKAIVKKVTEEYKKHKEESLLKDTSTQKNLVNKIKVDVEKEIAKFKANKDISNPKDRAEFEAYLDEKLKPAQEEVYRKKIKEATGLADKEFQKASEGLLGTGIRKALSQTFDELGLSKLADMVKPPEIANEVGLAGTAVGAGIMGQIAANFLGGGADASAPAAAASGGAAAGGGILSSIGGLALGIGKAVVLSPFVIAAGAALSYKVYQKYKETPEGVKRDALKKKFKEKKEELTKKIMREHKYEQRGKEEAVSSGMKNFFKGEKFDDDVLGEDLTVDELYEITQSDDYDLKEQNRAKKLIEEKKKEYMASKYNRQKTLLQETKGKKFKTPDGKRVDVKGLLDMEEDGNDWASEKLKDLRHTIEGVEEVKEEEEESETNKDRKLILSDKELSKYQDMTQGDLEKELLSLDTDQIKQREKQLERVIKQNPKQKGDSFDSSSKIKKRTPSEDHSTADISTNDAKDILNVFSKIKKEKESLESKFKNDTFKDPDGKEVSFNTLRKIVSDEDHANHTWGVKTYDGLKKKLKKMGAEKKDEKNQDDEINKIVKEKFESALTIDPSIIALFKEFSKDGKFDEEKFNEMLKGIGELGKMLSDDEGKKSDKKASEIKASLIKVAYLHPDLRKDILEFLK